jgi:hypothetical protein
MVDLAHHSTGKRIQIGLNWDPIANLHLNSLGLTKSDPQKNEEI